MSEMVFHSWGINVSALAYCQVLRLLVSHLALSATGNELSLMHDGTGSSELEGTDLPINLQIDDLNSSEKFPELSKQITGLHSIPDGGWRAWKVVLGSYCAIVSTFGLSNATGPIENYLINHQLKGYTGSQVGWIFSIWLFTMFIGAVQVGSVFDAYGLRPVLIPGCIGLVASIFILSVCSEYYQFILGFSILGGISCSLIFNPAYTVIGHWFIKRRGLATGIAATGASTGGIFMPPMLNQLFETVGYGWTIRILGFIILFLCSISCLTMEGRGTRRKLNFGETIIDVRSLLIKEFAGCVVGVFLTEWAMFVPVVYLVSYAQTQGLSSAYSNALITYLNVGSTFGRILPAYLADRFGVYNVMILTSFITGILCLALWLPAGHITSALTAFVVLFGFWSGSSISIAPVCVGAISETRHYGKRYGTAYTIASFAALTGLPIAGTLTANNYMGLIIFSGIAYIAASFTFALTRWWTVGDALIF